MIYRMLSVLVLSAVLTIWSMFPALGDVSMDSPFAAAVTTALNIPSSICSPKILHTAQIDPYALVEWQCGEGGGELLLQLKDGTWQPVNGDGGSYESRDLIALGVPAETAVQLVQQLQAQWGQEQ